MHLFVYSRSVGEHCYGLNMAVLQFFAPSATPYKNLQTSCVHNERDSNDSNRNRIIALVISDVETSDQLCGCATVALRTDNKIAYRVNQVKCRAVVNDTP